MAHEHTHAAGVAGAHRTADDEYLETPGSSYEHTDANVWAIVKFGFWLIVTAVVVHVGIGLMYSLLVERASARAEVRYPLAGEARLPPEPRLQESPRREIEDFRTAEERKLRGYGWVDREQGLVHIPVDEAMRLTLERGLPARTAQPGESLPEAPMLPSDASAGRVMERRRQ